MNITDKEYVVVGLVIIAVYALYTMGVKAESITNAIVAGMCGIAVGKSLP
jgi:hypothetical protein